MSYESLKLNDILCGWTFDRGWNPSPHPLIVSMGKKLTSQIGVMADQSYLTFVIYNGISKINESRLT